MALTLNPAASAVTVVGSTTLTAAQLQSTNVLRSGPTGAFADTIDTAANLYAGLGYAPGSYEVTYVNNSAYTCTITAGTGITLAGASAAIPANTLTALLIEVQTPTAAKVTVLFRATAA